MTGNLKLSSAGLLVLLLPSLKMWYELINLRRPSFTYTVRMTKSSQTYFELHHISKLSPSYFFTPQSQHPRSSLQCTLRAHFPMIFLIAQLSGLCSKASPPAIWRRLSLTTNDIGDGIILQIASCPVHSTIFNHI